MIDRRLYRSMTDTQPTIVRQFFDWDISTRGDGRTIEGIAVPWDVPATVSDQQGRYEEMFTRGSFTKTLNERGVGRVKLYVNHGHQRSELPVGVATHLTEDALGLRGTFRVSKVDAGDLALELVRDGVLDSLSVGVIDQPQTAQWSGLKSAQSPFGTAVTRTSVRLEEVSLVPHPAYEGATITGIRSTSLDGHTDEEDLSVPPGDAADPETVTRGISISDHERRLWIARFGGFTHLEM